MEKEREKGRERREEITKQVIYYIYKKQKSLSI